MSIYGNRTTQPEDELVSVPSAPASSLDPSKSLGSAPSGGGRKPLQRPSFPSSAEAAAAASPSCPVRKRLQRPSFPSSAEAAGAASPSCPMRKASRDNLSCLGFDPSPDAKTTREGADPLRALLLRGSRRPTHARRTTGIKKPSHASCRLPTHHEGTATETKKHKLHSLQKETEELLQIFHEIDMELFRI